MAHEMATHGLAHDKAKVLKKHLKEMHIRELHDGTHHVALHDGKGGITEHSAPTTDHLHDMLEAHMGSPNYGEEPDDMPSRAMGGPVQGMRPVRVGEEGPETFVPHTSGMIIPHRGAFGSPEHREDI